MEEVMDSNMMEEVKKVKDALALMVKVSEEGVKSPLLELMQASIGVELELLECALNREKLLEWFPERVLRENDLTDGMPRLRYESGKRWSLVICGRSDREMEEVYDYIQWIRIPKMAFQILKAMKTESTMVLTALTDKQHKVYNHLGDLAWEVLKVALDTLGTEKAATLMKIDPRVLRESLIKPKI